MYMYMHMYHVHKLAIRAKFNGSTPTGRPRERRRVRQIRRCFCTRFPSLVCVCIERRMKTCTYCNAPAHINIFLAHALKYRLHCIEAAIHIDCGAQSVAWDTTTHKLM